MTVTIANGSVRLLTSQEQAIVKEQTLIANGTAQRLKDELSYEPDTGLFDWKVSKSGRRLRPFVGTLNGKGYRTLRFEGTSILAHRVAWFLMTGEFPKKTIDHINGCRSDNRWCNLREATQQQNSMNRGPQTNNKSGYVGVSWHKKCKRWRAEINAKGRKIHIGMFKNIEDAARAYDAMALRLHGKWARLNFPRVA